MHVLSILSAALLSFLLAFQSPQDAPYLIHGRAVDAKGDPVKNASIGWGVEQERNAGDTTELVRSDERGRFTLPIPQYMKTKPIRLFVTSSKPKETTILLSAPFESQPEWFVKQYAGPRLVLDQQQQVSVGDIPVKMIFVPFTLKILDKKGIPKLTTLEDWRTNVVIRLLDKRGRPITSSTVSEWDMTKKRTVDLEKSEIKVTLPEGNWRIEVALGSFDGPFFGQPIHVTRSNSKRQHVTITIPS